MQRHYCGRVLLETRSTVTARRRCTWPLAARDCGRSILCLQLQRPSRVQPQLQRLHCRCLHPSGPMLRLKPPAGCTSSEDTGLQAAAAAHLHVTVLELELELAEVELLRLAS